MAMRKREEATTQDILRSSLFFSFLGIGQRVHKDKYSADHIDRGNRTKARRTGLVRLALLWWGKVDSNHRSDYATDLQSAPIGHSGIPPYNRFQLSPKRSVELVDGLEPPTC